MQGCAYVGANNTCQNANAVRPEHAKQACNTVVSAPHAQHRYNIDVRGRRGGAHAHAFMNGGAGARDATHIKRALSEPLGHRARAKHAQGHSWRVRRWRHVRIVRP